MAKRKKIKIKEEQYPESFRFWVIYDILFLLLLIVMSVMLKTM